MISEQLISEQELRWKCRRGMLELDLILNRFLDNHYQLLDAAELNTLVRLLDYPDQTLHDVLIGGVTSSDTDIAQLTTRISALNKT